MLCAAALMLAGSCAWTAWSTKTSARMATASAASLPLQTVVVDYPEDGAVFPPEITAPTFLWRDSISVAKRWKIRVEFQQRGRPIEVTSDGPGVRIGEIDPLCVSPSNELPTLTPEQAAAHTWKPDANTWSSIKKLSSTKPAMVVITGLDEAGREVSRGSVDLSTSRDPVAAPIFYRDVPLMPSEGANHTVQPLAPSKMTLINWRLRNLAKDESTIVMHDQHSCANCHSFSSDGKSLGLDVDGPGNDKGLYAVVPVRQQMTIRNEDIVRWNTDMQVGKSRVGFMSQISPDGRFVLTTFAGPQMSISNSYFVTNFKDYRFLQVFYPTRGILTWLDRSTGLRHPLPGADDARYVQTDGVWSADAKWIVFARADAKDPHPAGAVQPQDANDPNEVQIQYSLYRIPFNNGRGGQAEPVVGASNNGMSNNFPKISPDGRWIVFVKNRNGQLMRPDSELYIVPFSGGTARRMRCNTSLMNSWHSFSPNGRWLVFSSKSRSPYTQMFLTHIDEQGNDSPAILIDNSTAANRAVNIPEFVNIPVDGISAIETPATELYRLIDEATDLETHERHAAALVLWRRAVSMDADDPRANNGLGLSLRADGSPGKAIPYFRRAVDLHPTFTEAWYSLGTCLLQEHRLEEAIDAWQHAVALRPGYFQAHEGLGFAYFLAGKTSPALTHLRLALDGEPDRVPVLILAASLMATSPDSALRNGPEAVTLAERARNLTHGEDVSALDTLAAAYAEAGRFSKAVECARIALALAHRNSDLALERRIEAHLAHYEAYQPLRDPPDDGTL